MMMKWLKSISFKGWAQFFLFLVVCHKCCSFWFFWRLRTAVGSLVQLIALHPSSLSLSCLEDDRRKWESGWQSKRRRRKRNGEGVCGCERGSGHQNREQVSQFWILSLHLAYIPFDGAALSFLTLLSTSDTLSFSLSLVALFPSDTISFSLPHHSSSKPTSPILLFFLSHSLLCLLSSWSGFKKSTPSNYESAEVLSFWTDEQFILFIF